MSGALERLVPATSALLVVDLQEKLLPRVLAPARVVRATRLLLRAARVLSLPTLATTQVERALGGLVPEVSELLPEAARRFDKSAFSCFDQDSFADALREAAPAASTLLVAGIETHICVTGTVLGALRRGLRVQVVTDAVSAQGAADAEIGQRRMEQAGALMTSAEMAVYELLGGSSSAAFKALLPHLKEARDQAG